MAKRRIRPSEYARLTAAERLALTAQLVHQRWMRDARENQIPGSDHPDSWVTHLTMAGRGFGKTRSGAEWLLWEACRIPGIMAGILAPTFDHAEKVCLKGESGILSLLPDHSVVKWDSYRKQLVFPNGSIITTYSAERQGQLAGPQFHRFWIDEPADCWHGMEAWKKLRPAVRLKVPDGSPARILITGTPAPVPLVQHIWELHQKNPDIYTLSKGRTLDNEANLDPMMVQELYERYKGSRYFLQEMEGELLLQAEGALWTKETIIRCRVPYSPAMQFEQVIVSVDPAVSTDKKADETGIVVLGKSEGRVYVIADYSCKASALDWATLAFRIAEKHGARTILYERNLAGPLIEDVLKKVLHENMSKIKLARVQAKKKKQFRADPVSALYEAERVHHLSDTPQGWGSLEKLEAQMTTWEPRDTKSPDRIDAVVHGVDFLLLRGGGSSGLRRASESARPGARYSGW